MCADFQMLHAKLPAVCKLAAILLLAGLQRFHQAQLAAAAP